MMFFALPFVATASAAGIRSIGGGAADPIWAAACAMLPYCATPAGQQGIATAVGIVSNVILFTIGPAAVLVILYASARIVTSGGNDETVRKAMKEIILYALLGLMLAILSSTIINFVYNLITGIVSSV